MKKVSKALLCFVLAVSMAFTLVPAKKVYAGGMAAAICVKYSTLINTYGSGTVYEVQDTDELVQTVEGPEGTGTTERFYGDNCFHYYIKPTAGTYQVTDYNLPDGYELDKVALAGYPLSVEVTKEQVAEYKKNEKDPQWAGTEEYTIYIPIKLIGESSKLLTKPTKPDIQASYYKGIGTSTYISANNAIDARFGEPTLEVQYSTKKNGTYKKLVTFTAVGGGANLPESAYKKLKNNTTYYFKARLVNKIGSKTVKGPWSSQTKVKYQSK